MVEVRAQLNHLRMSPKKVRLVANAIKSMDAREALVRLRFIQKSAAQPIAKLLQSAIANAKHNNNLEADGLMVKSIVVNQGVALKRWRPAAFGSAHEFKKHASHITIILGLKSGSVPEKPAKEKARAAAAAKVLTATEKTPGKKSTPKAKAPNVRRAAPKKEVSTPST